MPVSPLRTPMSVGYVTWPVVPFVVQQTAISLQFLNVNIVHWKMLLQFTYQINGLLRYVGLFLMVVCLQTVRLL